MSEDEAELTSSAAAVEGDTNEQMQDDKALGASEGQHCADAVMRDNYKTGVWAAIHWEKLFYVPRQK